MSDSRGNKHTVFRQRLTRLRLTHFMKILEILKFKNFDFVLTNFTWPMARSQGVREYVAILNRSGI